MTGMRDLCIISVSRDGRSCRVKAYRTAVEAAADAGVSNQAIGQALKRAGGQCAGLYWRRVPRLYVVKGPERMLVCVRAEGGYREARGGAFVADREAALVADVTEPVWASSLARDL